jgi:hypothetical protein
MCEQWEASAQNLIAHFVCVLRGADPFALPWDLSSGNPERAALDREECAYLRHMTWLIGQRSELAPFQYPRLLNIFWQRCGDAI